MITNNTIKKLIDNHQNQTIDNIKYVFIGKGGDGVIYLIEKTNEIIKIYTKKQLDLVIRELYVLNLTKDLSNESKFNNNIIKIDKYNLLLDYPIIYLPVMNGNLVEWCMKVNHEYDNQKNYDKLWYSMIFQVAYGLCYLNGLNILHNDAKPKNILYQKQKPIINTYIINDKTYDVDMTYVFYVADFGAVQILGSKQNILSDNEIRKSLLNKQDLYELSKLIVRILVDFALKTYDIESLLKIDKTNYYTIIQKDFDNDKSLKSLPEKIKKNMMKRALLYYFIENNIIDKYELAKKNKFMLPSNKIMTILDNLIDSNNVFDLF